MTYLKKQYFLPYKIPQFYHLASIFNKKYIDNILKQWSANHINATES